MATDASTSSAPSEPAEPADASGPTGLGGPPDASGPKGSDGPPDAVEPGEPDELTEPPEPIDDELADADEPFEPDGWRPALRAFVPLVVLVALVAFLLSRHLTRDRLDHARVGDCVRVLSGGGDNPYRIVDCDEESASFRVLGRIPAGSEAGRRCRDVPGVSREFSVDGVTACLAEKDVDPATAVNGAEEGDCLNAHAEAQIVECGSVDAAYRVAEVLWDVPTGTAPTTCARVQGATTAYLWTLSASGPEASGGGQGVTYDLVLCLAPVS